jgi:tRNA-dihydrouridine synthase
MSSFWKKLADQSASENRAFTVLAPMEDVTDTVFRQIVLEEGRPDVFFTEFTNCDGLNSRGRDRVIHRLEYTPEQLPIIAQVWGRKPETYIATVPLLVEMGFTGVDVNMGCPVPKVIKAGAGGGLIRECALAMEIIQAMKEAVKATGKDDFTFSVKTRIGFKTIDFDWVTSIMSQKLDAITFHLRTVAEMSKVPAHWELAKEIVEIRNKVSPDTVLIGNGDVFTKEQLNSYRDLYGFEGLMVGRGIFTNLWIFSQELDDSTVTKEHRIHSLLKHLSLFRDKWTGQKNFELLKKFFKVYLKNFEGAAELKNTLQRLKTYDEMVEILNKQL